MNGGSSAAESRGAPGGGGAAGVALPLALAAMGPAMAAAHRRRGDGRWSGLVDAARETAEGLGIGAELWGEACGRLGRPGAALAILVMERAASRTARDGAPPIRRPCGYLRALMARAATGSLHLDRSVRAWAQRTDGRADPPPVAGVAAASTDPARRWPGGRADASTWRRADPGRTPRASP